MGKYQGYEKYKESGVEWLGAIPEHWKISKARFVSEIFIPQRNKPDLNLDEGLPWLTMDDMLTDRVSETSYKVTKEASIQSGSKSLKKGSVIASCVGNFSICTINDVDLIINQQLQAFIPNKDIIPEYLREIVRISGDYFQMIATSATVVYVNKSGFANMPVPLPPLDEQESIACFLDRKTSQIDTLIAKKEALLEKLDEKRTALISHAVTKGLDPSVPMKDSGVEWLGDIPEHWSITRLRFLVSKIEQGWSPSCHNYQAEEDEWGVLKAGCVNGEVLDLSENKLLPNELEPKLQYEIVDGDILMSRANTRELLGSVAIAISPRKKLILCDKLYRLEPNENINRQYLVRLLRSSIARLQYEQNATGASGSMQNIGQDTVKDLILPLPLLIEQREIAEYLDKKTAEIDRQKAKVKEAIELLKEYRTALITNAVTGKIDVRQVANV